MVHVVDVNHFHMIEFMEMISYIIKVSLILLSFFIDIFTYNRGQGFVCCFYRRITEQQTTLKIKRGTVFLSLNRVAKKSFKSSKA